jgi:hypothetical protein
MTIATTARTPKTSYSVVIVGTAPSALGASLLKQSVPVTLKVTN